MAEALHIYKDGMPVMSGIELRHGTAKLGGWSAHEIWHVQEADAGGDRVRLEERIGDLYCGYPKNFQPGWTFEIKPAELDHG